MLTIRTITKNLSYGQQSAPLRYILKGLDLFYDQVKSKIKITYCKHLNNGTYIYLTVPSENKPIDYDVALWFDTQKKVELDTELKIYANSPHFAFTFCYVFNQYNSLLFSENYNSEFLKTPPSVRNPFQTSGFDKHVYAALKHTYKLDLDAAAKYFESKPEPVIRTFEEMQKEIERLPKNKK